MYSETVSFTVLLILLRFARPQCLAATYLLSQV